MKTMIALAVILTILLIPCMLQAQADQQTEDEVVTFKYGVGFQGTFPASGLSGMMNITDDIAIQAIAGFFGTLRTFSGRGLYKFQQEEYWDLYGYGMIGAWSYKGLTSTATRKTETVLGLGIGGGIQYDWRAFNPSLPPIAWNLELGIGYVDFNEVDYSFSTIMIGAGIHYRF
jgi:uncharacterized membrane protein YciS (DUF1049 family)